MTRRRLDGGGDRHSSFMGDSSFMASSRFDRQENKKPRKSVRPARNYQERAFYNNSVNFLGSSHHDLDAIMSESEESFHLPKPENKKSKRGVIEIKSK